MKGLQKNSNDDIDLYLYIYDKNAYNMALNMIFIYKLEKDNLIISQTVPYQNFPLNLNSFIYYYLWNLINNK